MRQTIIEGMPRPSAVETSRDGGIYQSVRIDAEGRAIVTEYRVEIVGHQPCGWEHPTWPDEAKGRLLAHLQTCEMRTAEEES